MGINDFKQFQDDDCTYQYIIKSYSIKEILIEASLTGIAVHSVSDEITIPKALPSGVPITSISSFLSYEGETVERLTIPDEISFIAPSALKYVRAREIRWPAKCNNINECCFENNTTLEKLTGIENVEHICSEAFSGSSLKSIDWPDQCHQIPGMCFKNSSIEEISGLDHITEIFEYAFMNTNNLKVLDLSHIPYCVFYTASLCGLTAPVILPYYTGKDDIMTAYLDLLGLI